MKIDSAAVKGEDGTGFEKRGKRGPFECGNCHFFNHGHCEQKTMLAVSKQPKDEQGFPIVAAEDCCEYVSRKAKVFS